ncbi:IS3 family transposase [Streptomyces sp. NPDC056716]|uniref:IS3 family transposase n=1 Tax=unclassified Streptomyces TaxID=2593676 RepID=UPI003685A496
MNRFQFVADHQRRYGVKRLCSILGIARSSFYYWRNIIAGRAVRQAVDARLAARIRKVHHSSDGTYRVPRITAELREPGELANYKKVARIMRQCGLAGLRLRRKHRTTIADPAAAKAADLIGRDFTAAAVNTKYVGDITYLPQPAGSSCVWPRSSTSPPGAWPAGRSATTCAPNWSSKPWPLPSSAAAAWPEPSYTPLAFRCRISHISAGQRASS